MYRNGGIFRYLGGGSFEPICIERMQTRPGLYYLIDGERINIYYLDVYSNSRHSFISSCGTFFASLNPFLPYPSAGCQRVLSLFKNGELVRYYTPSDFGIDFNAETNELSIYVGIYHGLWFYYRYWIDDWSIEYSFFTIDITAYSEPIEADDCCMTVGCLLSFFEPDNGNWHNGLLINTAIFAAFGVIGAGSVLLRCLRRSSRKRDEVLLSSQMFRCDENK